MPERRPKTEDDRATDAAMAPEEAFPTGVEEVVDLARQSLTIALTEVTRRLDDLEGRVATLEREAMRDPDGRLADIEGMLRSVLEPLTVDRDAPGDRRSAAS